MLPRSRFTPYYVLSISLILDFLGFFTSSAVIWPYGSIGLSILNGISVALLIYTATCIDPAMDELIEKRKTGFKPLPWSPSTGHVIEDQLCRICLIYAPKGTKHCRVCNICVQNFDHHCVWLNRCIGSKNYTWFLILIASVVVNAGVVAVFHLAALAMWFAKSEYLATIIDVNGSLIIQLPLFSVHLYLWVGFSLAILIIAVFTFLPVMNLLFFHLRLGISCNIFSYISTVKNGKSTYMVIMEHRQKKKASETGASHQSTLSEVKIIGGRSAVAPSSNRSVRDIPPQITPRIMETEFRQDSPRYRASRDGLPDTVY